MSLRTLSLCSLPFVHGVSFILSLISHMVARWLPTAPGIAFFLIYAQREKGRGKMSFSQPNKSPGFQSDRTSLGHVFDGNGLKLNSN